MSRATVGVPVAKAQLVAPPRLMVPVNYPASMTAIVATADATTIHTPGAWVELIASTAAAADFLVLTLAVATNVNGASSAAMIDIAIGAAASEVVVFPSIQMGHRGVSYDVCTWLPLFIPKGSRVSFRAQAVTLSKTISVFASTFSTGSPSSRSFAAIGANTTTSLGTGIAHNVWTQITASTLEPFVGLVYTIGRNGVTLGGGSTVTHIEIGYGAAGAEITLGFLAGVGGTLESWDPTTPQVPIYAHLPKGTRLAARRTGQDVAIDVTLWGIREGVVGL